MIIQSEKPIIEVHDLTVSYGKKPVLWSVDFSLPGGIIAGIMGPNGSGKSTLIRSMMGLLPYAGGYVKIMGESPEKVRQRISYVPQKETVDWDFPATVQEVVMMGRYGKLGLWKRPGKMDRIIVDDSIEKLGLSPYRNRQIAQLSGGQQQRVFLARAIAQQADLYFLDEPFVGVDATTEDVIIELLKDLRNQGKTIVIVHHNLQTAERYFDWLILLNMRLVAAGPVKEVFKDQLLEETYGGKLSLLSSVAQHMQREQYVAREKL